MRIEDCVLLTLGFLKATVFLQWKVIVCAALYECNDQKGWMEVKSWIGWVLITLSLSIQLSRTLSLFMQLSRKVSLSMQFITFVWS